MPAISSTITTDPYTGNGVTTAFPFDFSVATASELLVQVNGVTVVSYTVALNENNTGTVTFAVAPAVAAVILLSSAPDFLQDTEFENEGAYNLDSVNRVNRRQSIRSNYLNRQVEAIEVDVNAVSGVAAQAIAARDEAEGFALATETTVAGGWFDTLASGAATVAEGEGFFVKDATQHFYTGQKTGGVGVKGAEFFTRALWETDYRPPLSVTAHGAVGDGITNDTAAIQALLTAGNDVNLPGGKTFRITAPLTISTNFQRFGGAGKLKPDGAFDGVVVQGGCAGVELDLTFESATHTVGYAVKIANANRVRIRKLYGVDVYGGLYIEQANTVAVDWMWATCRGPGIVWYGNDTKRSDILVLSNCVVRPGVGFYGLDWNGNCNSLVIEYLGLVCGSVVGAANAKGFIIRNIDGVSSFPAIGRISHIEVDYPTGSAIEITAGLDYDFIMPYVLGSNVDGIRIGATINNYEVRIVGGKSVGNTGYGINALGGVVLYSGSTALYSNTAGEIAGNVWTKSPRQHIDLNYYQTLDTGNPVIVYDLTDYTSYNRASNILSDYIGGNLIFERRATYTRTHKPMIMPSYTVAALPAATAYMTAFVTDATVTTFNSVVAGGGANKVPVFYDGAAWRIG